MAAFPAPEPEPDPEPVVAMAEPTPAPQPAYQPPAAPPELPSDPEGYQVVHIDKPTKERVLHPTQLSLGADHLPFGPALIYDTTVQGTGLLLDFEGYTTRSLAWGLRARLNPMFGYPDEYVRSEGNGRLNAFPGEVFASTYPTSALMGGFRVHSSPESRVRFSLGLSLGAASVRSMYAIADDVDFDDGDTEVDDWDWEKGDSRLRPIADLGLGLDFWFLDQLGAYVELRSMAWLGADEHVDGVGDWVDWDPRRRRGPRRGRRRPLPLRRQGAPRPQRRGGVMHTGTRSLLWLGLAWSALALASACLPDEAYEDDEDDAHSDVCTELGQVEQAFENGPGDDERIVEGWYSSCGGGDEALVWTWIAPWDGCFTFSSQLSDFDTVLDLLEGECGGNVLECDDDGGGDSTSRIDYDVDEGDTYTIVLSSYYDAFYDDDRWGLFITPCDGSEPDTGW